MCVRGGGACKTNRPQHAHARIQHTHLQRLLPSRAASPQRRAELRGERLLLVQRDAKRLLERGDGQVRHPIVHLLPSSNANKPARERRRNGTMHHWHSCSSGPYRVDDGRVPELDDGVGAVAVADVTVDALQLKRLVKLLQIIHAFLATHMRAHPHGNMSTDATDRAQGLMACARCQHLVRGNSFVHTPQLAKAVAHEPTGNDFFLGRQVLAADLELAAMQCQLRWLCRTRTRRRQGSTHIRRQGTTPPPDSQPPSHWPARQVCAAHRRTR